MGSNLTFNRRTMGWNLGTEREPSQPELTPVRQVLSMLLLVSQQFR
jgi:hypothetical protein